MKLHLLGINGPFPDRNGFTSGYLLKAGEHLLQFDLGSGVLSLLTALTAPESISAVLFSHWHYDHSADLPVLMYRLQALGRRLPVFGPKDPSSPVYQLAVSESCFSFTEVSAGYRFEIGGISVSAVSARHPVPAVGYRVFCDGKTFGYTGDTNILPSHADQYRGCDLLLADGMFPSSLWSEEKPHLSAELAARLASDSAVRELIITHLNPFIPRQRLLDEARAVFPSVRLAEAGCSIIL